MHHKDSEAIGEGCHPASQERTRPPCGNGKGFCPDAPAGPMLLVKDNVLLCALCAAAAIGAGLAILTTLGA